MKTIGITFGDVAGVGPEVALKAIVHSRVPEQGVRFVLLGEENYFRRLCAAMGEEMAIPVIRSAAELENREDYALLLDTSGLDLSEVPFGQVNRTAGEAALHWIEEAVALCSKGVLDAMVTGPVNKEGLALAGCRHAGHTGLLAELTKAKSHAMMLVGGPLRVALVTTHIPLRAVPDAISKERILEVIAITSQWLKKLGIAKPTLAVAGLNPHAGENGQMGTEELEIIGPAVEQAVEVGMSVVGPLPPDTVFYRALHDQWDAVVCMYHDQGLGPLKMLAFDQGVNVTLGLPIIRTSPDHGTAYDIAGQGIAVPDSMVEAINLACQVAGASSQE
jgi:4-hydroxythreonine-4-phosphate dehydrogenase